MGNAVYATARPQDAFVDYAMPVARISNASTWLERST
jgi:hypothetical protein